MIFAELLGCVFWQQVGAPDALAHAAILRGLRGQTSIIQEILESTLAPCPGPVSVTAQMLNPVTLVWNSLIETHCTDCCCARQGFHPTTVELGHQEGLEKPRTIIMSMKHWHPPPAGRR